MGVVVTVFTSMAQGRFVGRDICGVAYVGLCDRRSDASFRQRNCERFLWG